MWLSFVAHTPLTLKAFTEQTQKENYKAVSMTPPPRLMDSRTRPITPTEELLSKESGLNSRWHSSTETAVQGNPAAWNDQHVTHWGSRQNKTAWKWELGGDQHESCCWSAEKTKVATTIKHSKWCLLSKCGSRTMLYVHKSFSCTLAVQQSKLQYIQTPIITCW